MSKVIEFKIEGGVLATQCPYGMIATEINCTKRVGSHFCSECKYYESHDNVKHTVNCNCETAWRKESCLTAKELEMIIDELMCEKGCGNCRYQSIQFDETPCNKCLNTAAGQTEYCVSLKILDRINQKLKISTQAEKPKIRQTVLYGVTDEQLNDVIAEFNKDKIVASIERFNDEDGTKGALVLFFFDPTPSETTNQSEITTGSKENE